MTSDRPRRNPARWLAGLALLAVLVAGCGDSSAKKSDAPAGQPSPQPPLKQQKAPPPGTIKME